MKKTTKTATVKQTGSRLCINTDLGQLIAYLSNDPAHPGIFIDLAREGYSYSAPIALIEFTSDDTDESGQDLPPSIISRIWGDAEKEDYTDTVVIQNLDKYFSEEN